MLEHKANLGSVSLRETTILADAGGHGHVLGAFPVKPASGIIGAGQVVAENADGQVVLYGQLTKSLGAGDGAAKTFGGVLGPCLPGSVAVTAGAEVFADDGFGALTGSAGGTGKVNYATGKLAVTCNAAPANAAAVSASYKPRIKGVATRPADTASEAGVEVCIHGAVVRKSLLAGEAAPGAEILAELEQLGVWPR